MYNKPIVTIKPTYRKNKNILAFCLEKSLNTLSVSIVPSTFFPIATVAKPLKHSWEMDARK